MEYGSETDNYYAYARYYDPQLGRFLSPDPLGGDVDFPQTLNRYAYAVNNPETFIDPSGAVVCGKGTITNYGSGKVPIQFWSSLLYCSGGGVGVGGSAGGGAELLEWGWNGHAFDPNANLYPLAARFTSRLGNLTSRPQKKEDRAVCAAKLADQYSIAGAAGTTGKKGFWANVFNGLAGNTISSIVLVAHGGGNKWRVATTVNNFTFKGTGKAVNLLTTPAPTVDLGMGAETADEAAVTFVGEGLGNIVFGLKIGYDVLSFAGAYLACGP